MDAREKELSEIIEKAAVPSDFFVTPHKAYLKVAKALLNVGYRKVEPVELEALGDVEIELAWSFAKECPTPEAGGINPCWLPRRIIMERDRIISQATIQQNKVKFGQLYRVKE